MHDIRETSLEVFHEEIQPELGRRQKIVLMAFKRRNIPSSDKEISKFLGNPINSITPRRNELVEDGLIEEVKREKCEVTGRKVIKWGLTDKGRKMIDNIEESLKDLRDNSSENSQYTKPGDRG